MVKLYDGGVYLVNGREIVTDPAALPGKCGRNVTKEEAEQGTIAYGILKAHNESGDMQNLRMRFDSLTSHDITYVGIIQTARASGMKKFPMPYVLTNCHNSLCAVGGTINEDDHMFALSAAHKYGGIYVPTNMAVIHSYNREMMSGCGRMILGSDSHTRYGALGTLAVGEGGGELAKQLVGRTYDVARPGVVAIYLTGKPRDGVGPQDVALSIIGAVYAKGYVKNKVMEFVGPGVANLPIEYRNGIDVMTTETTCWSSIWETDQNTKDYLTIHGRPEAFKPLKPAEVAYYDGCVYVDLATVECTIALPMHPSYTYIRECFCGPCFGAGDTPANGEFSIRHTTRNFPNREGSKPGEGQMAGVALMDARSIAATAINGGRLTAATDLDVAYTHPQYFFDGSVYEKRVYNGYGKAEPEHELRMGPNIKDWPEQPALSDDLLVKVVSYITDPVTTTDELIPSGETSSYRSNPLRLAEFALSRKDPAYVGRAKAVHAVEAARERGEALPEDVQAVYAALTRAGIASNPAGTVIGSTIYANKPGDGSAREQAASCQRVLGACANIAMEYATKRYRSNCINWGMAPLLTATPEDYALGDWVFVPGIREAILSGRQAFDAYVVKADGSVKKTSVSTGALTEDERQIIADGCLINYYRNN